MIFPVDAAGTDGGQGAEAEVQDEPQASDGPRRLVQLEHLEEEHQGQVGEAPDTEDGRQLNEEVDGGHGVSEKGGRLI